MTSKRQTGPGHERDHYPEITQEVLNENTAGADQDKLGSYTGNRRGSLHGAPNVTWFSTNTQTRNIQVEPTESYTIYIQGYNMQTMSNLYLSAANPDMFDTQPQVFNFFETTYINRLKDENPAFTGIPIKEWVIINDNNITFKLPPVYATGEIDIILQGPAGYNLASESVFTDTLAQSKYLTVQATTGTNTTATTATTGLTG